MAQRNILQRVGTPITTHSSIHLPRSPPESPGRSESVCVDSVPRKSDPDRPSRSAQERSKSESYLQQTEHSKAIMNMKQEGPFLVPSLWKDSLSLENIANEFLESNVTGEVMNLDDFLKELQVNELVQQHEQDLRPPSHLPMHQDMQDRYNLIRPTNIESLKEQHHPVRPPIMHHVGKPPDLQYSHLQQSGLQEMSSHHHPHSHQLNKEQQHQHQHHQQQQQQSMQQSIPQASVRPLVRPVIMSPGRQSQQQQQQSLHLHMGGGGRGPQVSPGRSQMSPSGSGKSSLLSPLGGGGAGASRSLISPGCDPRGLMSPGGGGGGSRQCLTSDPLSPDRSQLGSPDKERMPSKAKKRIVRKERRRLSSEDSDEDSHYGGGFTSTVCVNFSPDDLRLATIPGQDFDPATRRFSEEELKPQPIIRKRKKQFVPDELKNNKYWAKRTKNNEAAKRSREARRLKENQIAMRARYLEEENLALKGEVDNLKKENTELKQMMVALEEKLNQLVENR